jgi:hypothetical protein
MSTCDCIMCSTITHSLPCWSYKQNKRLRCSGGLFPDYAIAYGHVPLKNFPFLIQGSFPKGPGHDNGPLVLPLQITWSTVKAPYKSQFDLSKGDGLTQNFKTWQRCLYSTCTSVASSTYIGSLSLRSLRHHPAYPFPKGSRGIALHLSLRGMACMLV